MRPARNRGAVQCNENELSALDQHPFLTVGAKHKATTVATYVGK